MKKKNTPGSRQKDHQSSSHSPTEDVILPTIDLIKKKFRKTHDITTIQLENTILYQDRDSDRGAKTFRELVGSLFEHVKENDPKPRAIWLIQNTLELEHVIGEMKKHSRKLFDNLNAHASIAIIGEKSKYRKSLLKASGINSSCHRRQTLTAFPSGSGYIYYGHFKPSDNQSWKNGPLCSILHESLVQIDNLIRILHEAHDERICGTQGSKQKLLGNAEISLISLNELLEESSFFYDKN